MSRLLPRAFMAAACCGAAVAVVASPAPVDSTALASAVRTEFLHAWNGYAEFASGHDDLRPLSRSWRDWYGDGQTLYMTPVDSLDTMIVMGLTDEATKTRQFIDDHLSFDKDIAVSNFEITIRILGGLLSAHQLTRDPRLLALAKDLGTRLMPAFRSPTGMPYRFVNLKTGAVSGAVSNPAEIGTLILEFGTLSKLTGDPAFFDAAKRALVALYDRRSKTTGLVGESIDVENGKWTSPTSHIGGGIDSYYEYLVKCDRLFGDADCRTMGREGLAAVNKYLADERPDGLWYGEADMATGARTATTFGSLQAFFPAVLALGGDLDRARRLQASSLRMWTLAGIEPEELDYSSMRIFAPGYQLRPEIAESAYYLFHATHDPRYLEMGRTIFDALRRHCRTDVGYTVLTDVVHKQQGDLMPSFFLAETLKYLYLLFKPDALDFDRVTFNTEGHPLRRAGAAEGRRR